MEKHEDNLVTSGEEALEKVNIHTKIHTYSFSTQQNKEKYIKGVLEAASSEEIMDIINHYGLEVYFNASYLNREQVEHKANSIIL